MTAAFKSSPRGTQPASRAMARDRFLRLLLPAATLLIGLALWEAVVDLNAIPPYVLPAPTLIAKTLVTDWQALWASLLVTLGTTVQGLLLAFGGGVALAILFNQSRLVEYSFYPYAVILQVTPVVAIAPNDALLDKLKSNLQEVRARGGELYVVADLDSHLQASEGIHVIRLPEYAGLLSPVVHTIPLQLLAYHTAVLRGTDVDKPRNLAKSVTVE